MKLPKNFIPISIVFVTFLFLIAFGGYLYLSLQEDEVIVEGTPVQVVKPLPGSEQFTTKDYIQALEGNTTGSAYSSRAQLRGVVSSWNLGSIIEKGTLAIMVGEEEFAISLPSEVELRCLPLTKTSVNGTTYKMSEVYIDLTNSQGTLTDTDVVSQKIPEGADITIQVDVDEQENMEVTFVLGYGCDE